jgi:acyl carrier protein
MTKAEIADGLRELLRKQKQLKVDVEKIRMDTRFDQIGFDSLSILDFMYDVENRFAVVPEMADLVRMQKVDDLIDYLHTRIRP